MSTKNIFSQSSLPEHVPQYLDPNGTITPRDKWFPTDKEFEKFELREIALAEHNLGGEPEFLKREPKVSLLRQHCLHSETTITRAIVSKRLKGFA